MQHLRKIETIFEKEIWASIGAFDGVHLGHQQLIGSMVQLAKKIGVKTAVITFYPHPAVIIRQINEAYYLTSPDEKADIFDDLGIDYTITIPFDKNFANLSSEEFIQKLLFSIPITQFWIGNDFTFGKKRSGNTEVLNHLGLQYGFKTKIFDHILQNSNKVSSSKIREWVLSGEMGSATNALGRPYSLIGSVIHGDERGRKIGFPTANLSIWEEKILPPAGVYATLALIEGKIHHSVTNVGFRPTFKNNQIKPQVETFIHDFHKSIYELPVQLFFIERLRPEIKFESISAITDQIKKDVLHAEEILKNAENQTSLFIGSSKTTP
ncbi:MAG: bifunctional riboflavin kinase/FAD synthetase [Anaerolineaceae bacterium]